MCFSDVEAKIDALNTDFTALRDDNKTFQVSCDLIPYLRIIKINDREIIYESHVLMIIDSVYFSLANSINKTQ